MERGALHNVLNLRLDQFHHLIIDCVGFRNDYQPSPDLQDIQDCQVLPGLRHDAFVGRYDQHGKVYSADSGQHVLDKPFVSRDVDNADLASAGQGHPGKAQVNRHFPFDFFGQSVRVDAGKGLDQGGFTVVDVAGGPDDVHRWPS